MFSLSKGQRQQPPISAASVGGAPASSAVAAASAEISAAEPATSVTVPSAASIRGQSTRASRPLERCHRTRQRRRQRRPAVLLPLLRRRQGRLEPSRQQLGPLVTAGRGRSARVFEVLFAKESIGAAIATSAAPHSEGFGRLRAVGTFEELGGT